MTEKRPPRDKETGGREDRLAEALRANLRRRKAAKRAASDRSGRDRDTRNNG